MVWYDIITTGNFGWAGQLIPLIIVAGMSFGLARKTKDMLFIQFPLMIAIKVIFPFFHVSWIFLGLGLVVINIMTSKNDMIEEVKSIPKLRSKLHIPELKSVWGKARDRNIITQIKEGYRERIADRIIKDKTSSSSANRWKVWK